jgi:hypothetical protein
MNKFLEHIFDFGMSSEDCVTCPFVLAVLQGMHVVAHILYESGSCSNTQLLQYYVRFLHLTTEPNLVLEQASLNMCDFPSRYIARLKNIERFMPQLKKMATTPRQLKSTCRLVISRCLDVRGRREKDVQQLNALSEDKKRYVLFSDLTDPGYIPRRSDKQALLVEAGTQTGRLTDLAGHSQTTPQPKRNLSDTWTQTD